MAVVVLPIHPGSGIIQMLPGATAQPGLVHRVLLGVELVLAFD